MKQHPPGYRLVWGSIAAGFLALLAYQGQHHPGTTVPTETRAAGAVTAAPSPSPAAPSLPVPWLAVVPAAGLPVRSAGLEVRVALVAASAPPFPLLPGVELEESPA